MLLPVYKERIVHPLFYITQEYLMKAVDWNTYARAYDLLCAIRPYRAMHRTASALMKHHHKKHGDYILDAGCGTGNFMTHLAVHKVPKSHMIGIDASSIMCIAARKKHGESGARIYEGSLNAQLPFQESMFSGIACINALYAVHDPVETVREFARVLRPDGALLIATPHEKANIGLILKAHAKSFKSDYYWMQFSKGGDIARELIAEACKHDNLNPHLLEVVFSANTAITEDTHMHFMSAARLNEVCLRAGLTVQGIQETYGGQAHLAYVTHSSKERRAA